MKSTHNLIRNGAVATLLIGSCAAAWGIPAIRDSFKVKQPDGTELTLRLIGDARSHIYLTEDDCPVIYDPAFGYVHATYTSDGRALSSKVTAHDAALRNVAEKRIARNMTAQEISEAVADRGLGLNASTFPNKGEVRTLVILVEFQDVKFGDYNKPEYKYDVYSNSATPVTDYWNDLLNKEGFDGFGGTGSCRDWFHANSADADGKPQFDPHFDLFGPVTLPENVAYYGGNTLSGTSVDQAAEQIVVQGCQLLDDQIDFSIYDTDGDGRVDNVFVFYAGLGENDGGGAETIWPHSWDLSRYGCEIELDGVIVDHYACSKETLNGAFMPDGIGTFIHEFSHVLGLPDLYTTDYNTAYTPGKYSVLDAGPYNNTSRTPPNYSTYERWALGWMKPDRFNTTGYYTIGNMADTRDVYIVPTEKDNEYYLIENRQNKGWDAYLPGHGMLIWHIDYNREVFDNATVNNDPRHQYVDLIEANGRKNERYVAGHPFPGESNVMEYNFVSWSGEDCGVKFTEISETPDGDINLYATLAGDAAVETIETVDPDARYYNLQGEPVATPQPGQLLIRLTPDGATKILAR